MANAKLYSTIGVKVTLNSTEIENVVGLGAIGGEPNRIDVTCFKDTVRKYILGVQEYDNFPITFLRNTDDSPKVAAAVTASKTAPVAIEIELPDGSKWTNSCEVSSMINDLGIDGRLEGVANCALQGEWTEGTVTP